MDYMTSTTTTNASYTIVTQGMLCYDHRGSSHCYYCYDDLSIILCTCLHASKHVPCHHVAAGI